MAATAIQNGDDFEQRLSQLQELEASTKNLADSLTVEISALSKKIATRVSSGEGLTTEQQDNVTIWLLEPFPEHHPQFYVLVGVTQSGILMNCLYSHDSHDSHDERIFIGTLVTSLDTAAKIRSVYRILTQWRDQA